MEQSDDDESITIDPDGDVFLRVASAAANTPAARYRVSASKLRAVSAYFRTLFDPSKFHEGVSLAAQHRRGAGQTKQPNGNSAPLSVAITDLGVPVRQSGKDLFAVFLQCAHDPGHVPGIEKWAFAAVYCLVRIADRFLARAVLAPAVQSIRNSAKHSPRSYKKTKSEVSERACRQKLVAGLFYGLEEWVSFFSWRLAVQGSKQWLEVSDDEELADEGEDPELWHLPEGLEEELERRRMAILDTLGSVQDALVGKYLGKERVCRSGLDSSMQCDMFQLGQALRFLGRKELVSLRSSVGGQDFKASSSESALKICAALMECPSYQIDLFHQNCGLRSRLVRCVEIMQQLISTDAHVGVCLACWRGRRSEHSWAEGAPKDSERDVKNGNGPGLCSLRGHGREVADLFTKGSFVERCESGWRPQNWRFQWMHEVQGVDAVARAI